MLAALELEGRGEQLLAEPVRHQLGRDQVHAGHELLEVVVAHDQPLEPELVAAPLDLRVRLLRDRVQQLLQLVLRADELGRGQRLEDDGRVAGRLQPEVGLERDPSRRDGEELLLLRLRKLLAPEEDVGEAQG